MRESVLIMDFYICGNYLRSAEAFCKEQLSFATNGKNIKLLQWYERGKATVLGLRHHLVSANNL